MAGFDPDKYLQEKTTDAPKGFDPDAYLQEKMTPVVSDDGPSLAKDAYVKTTEGLLFGARPFVAGVGGGLGGVAERLGRDDEAGLLERIKDLPERFQKGFIEERAAARAEEADVSQRRPGMSLGIGLTTALATAPLVAARGLQAVGTGGKILSGVGQAAKVGAGLGAAQALGHADSSGEAVEMVGTGALTGAAVQGTANAVSKAAPYVVSGLKKGATKLGSSLTGVSEKEIQTYASRADEVKDLLKKSGGDLSEAADQVRRGVMKDIQVTRQKLGSQIGAALEDPRYQSIKVDGKAIIEPLENSLKSVNGRTAQFDKEDINQLKNVIDLTKQSFDEAGQVDLKTLSSLKEKLQDIAKPSYMGGQVIFPRGSMAAKASKGAAAEARRLLNEQVPEIAKANNQLSKLHRIEELMNKNLIREGKPEAALMAAGSGGNPRNAKILESIDQITGGSAVKGAENLAAARSFANPDLLAKDTTGKALARMAAGGGAGFVIGGPVGSAIGSAATSPMSLKLAIETARFSKRLGNAVGSGISKALPKAPANTGTAALIAGEEARQTGRKAETDVINRRMERLRGTRKPPAQNE